MLGGRHAAGTRLAARGIVAAAAPALALLAAPAPASAHALVGRTDLPIPDWLFAWGASVVLIVSFIALSLAWRESRFEGDSWRPVADRVSRSLVNPVLGFVAGALAVFLLGVVVWSGLYGTEAPDQNFSLTFVFITFWLGLVLASVLLGDVFRALNPWRAIARTVAAGFRLITAQSPPAPLRYPERLGRWPAVAGIVAFGWLELVYGQSGFQAVGLVPHTVAIAAVAYSAYTFVGMALFGIETWLDRGEAFSVYFGMFSRLAPLEVRDGRLGVRRWLSATTTLGQRPGLDRAGAGDDRDHDLRRRPGGSCSAADRRPLRGPGRPRPRPDRRPAPHERLFFALSIAAVAGIFWAGVARHADGARVSSARSLGERSPTA